VSTPLDPRRNAYRDDLAAESLRGLVTARRYAPGETRQVISPVAPVRRRPEPQSALNTEALFGELVTVYDEAEGWAWVQLAGDGYVGYVPARALSSEVHRPTHRVKALGTFVFSAPDLKAPPLMHLGLNAALAIAETSGTFARLVRGGYVPLRHIAEWGRHAADFVDVAERLIGTPYLWGGKTRLGVDCSGLVQLALQAAGRECPRDTDMQEAELGEPVAIGADLEGLARGDLVFWKGHVGIMTGSFLLLHANAHHMAVAIEPVARAAARIASIAGPITSIKRLGASWAQSHTTPRP
jgi:cell wall-associated NlpC family hydrolase